MKEMSKVVGGLTVLLVLVTALAGRAVPPVWSARIGKVQPKSAPAAPSSRELKSRPARLAPSSGKLFAPLPAGTAQPKLAFASDRNDENFEIYTAAYDGTNVTRLTTDPADDLSPAFSPDGSKIAFVSNRDGNTNIYVMDADGANQTRLTSDANADLSPSFSPDGSKIAFVSNRTGNDEIFVMDVSGSNQLQLTNNPQTDFGPAWSPDGTRLTFASERDGNSEIYTMLANGNNQTNLTNNSADDLNPVWSSGKITFQSDRSGNFDIYSMNDQNGSGLVQLTSDPADDTDPARALNNAQLAFISARDGNYELYTANDDGSNQTKVTTDEASDLEPTLTTINLAPTLDAIGPLTIPEDSGPQIVNLTGITAGPNENQVLTVTALSDNTSVVPHPVVSYTSPNSTGSLTITPPANANGTANITVTVTDDGGTAGGGVNFTTRTFAVNVTPVNDPPTANAQTVSTNEDTPLGITLTGSDVETASANLVLTVTVQPAHGSLSGVGAIRTYTPDGDYNGSDSFKFTVTDTGDGSSPALTSAEATVTIMVNAVNDAPVNTVPGAQSVTENSTLAFSASGGDPVSVTDVDAGTNSLQVQLTATNGTLTLSTTSGLSVNGNGTAAITANGTASNINAALNGLVFAPTAGYSGPASVQLVTSDQGNTGSGGSLSDTDTISITVNEGGTFAFSATTYSVAENAGAASITINRTGGSAGTASVLLQTSDGTAIAGQDYTAVSQTVTFNAGETTKSVNVSITDDALNEAAETVNLTLLNAGGSGALGTPATAALTITDNDPQPSLSVNDVTLNEGNSGTTAFTFTVTLSAASGQTVSVNYGTSDGTATVADSDYQSQSNALTFTPGETTKNITVLVNGDAVNESGETFMLNLSNAANATFARAQGLGTILNDDTPQLQFSSATYNVNESGLHATITVNRLGDSSSAATVDYATSDPSGLNNCSQVTGNASQRCDYATSVGTLRFAAGEASKTIFIPIVNDVYVEGPEVFTIKLSNSTDGLGSPTTATVTITDDDNGVQTNPITNDAFFIRQLYIDFLGREPEPAGLQGWLNILNHCAVPTDCDRINVALGFVKSPEFQDRGYFAFRFYLTALGRNPKYSEFIPDMARLSGFLNPSELEANKAAFVQEFMTRQEFKNLYDPTSGDPTSYVDKLLQSAGLPNHPARNAWIAGLSNNSLTRGQVLRQLIESTEVYAKFYNQAIIVMNYFGFLRRDPDAAYQAWIDIFNHTNDYRVITNGFINSPEYPLRVGP